MINPSIKMQMLERAAATFAQAFLSVFVIADVSTAKTAAVAGVAALLSLVKGWAATKVGDPNSASLV